MTQRQASATRDRILAVALELFAQHGYAGTSIRDIADRMGITKAAVYYHFRSKVDLLAEVLQPAMARVEAVLIEHGRPTDRTGRRRLVDALVDVIVEFGTQVAVMMSDPAAGAHLRALSGATGLPERVGLALLDPPRSVDATVSDRIRAACLVACLPAGIAAWRQGDPDGARPDEATRELLVNVVLAVADAG